MLQRADVCYVCLVWLQAWRCVLSEMPCNVDVNDAELTKELTIPWKYFVLFVSIDLEAIEEDSRYTQLHTAIRHKQCSGEQLRFFFDGQLDALLLSRVVLAFTDAVEMENLTTTLHSVSYNLNDEQPIFEQYSTASFVFSTNHHRYVATSLHGKFDARKQRVAERPVILADALRAGGGEGGVTGEVGHVVCDWRNNFVDVGLIQLQNEEHKSAAAGFSEDQVHDYMKELVRAVIGKGIEPIHPSRLRVLVHCAGANPIPGSITHVKTVLDREMHLIVQYDVGEVELGQSGCAVTLESDGRPVGMLVARSKRKAADRYTAVVTPLHYIYCLLNDVLGRDASKVQLCHRLEEPLSVATPGHVHVAGENKCVECGAVVEHYNLITEPYGIIGGLLKTRCTRHRWAHEPVRQMSTQTFLSVPDGFTFKPSCFHHW